MAQTIYENYPASHARTMETEDTFANGMKYVSSPLVQGYLRNIVNMNISQDGGACKLRAGFKAIDEPINFSICSDDADLAIHHTDKAYVRFYQDDDAVVCQYAIIGNVMYPTEAEILAGVPEAYMPVAADSMRCIIKYDGRYIKGTLNIESEEGHTYGLLMKPNHNTIHGMNIKAGKRDGLYTIYDNNTYLTMVDIWHEGEFVRHAQKLVRLDMEFNNIRDGFAYSFVDVIPNEITAVQAVNYGYNMLLPEPYTFTNKVTQTSAIILDGLIPYDVNGNLITSCRQGTEITFRLAYRYPQTHVTNGKQYYVQWELCNTDDAEGTTQVLQYARQSQAYNPGDTIEYTVKNTTYTSFTLICKIYDKADYDALTFESFIMDGLNTQPLNTLTVSYSYLTAESNASALNLAAQTYDLGTAEGMCTWQQRLVLWGVQGCRNTIWISEVNDPSYFPYPNNIEVFDSDIITCVRYKTSLLVFTENALYQLDFSAEDGLTLKSSIIQERLTMERADCSTIIPIQNMVFFKNGNYYYMLVPGKYGTNQYGELTLAPISTPINEIFDDFPKFLKEMYGDGEVSIIDWWCYLEGNYFRACYKLTQNTDVWDLVFQYDTKTRTWVLHEYEFGQYRTKQWISSVTADSIFINLRASDWQNRTASIDLLQADPTTSVDDNRVVSKQPVVGRIDTGERSILPTLVKKFRQLQFTTTTEDVVHIGCIVNSENQYSKNMPEQLEDDTMYFSDVTGNAELEISDSKPIRWTQVEWNAMRRVSDEAHKTITKNMRCCIPMNVRGRLCRFQLIVSGTDRPEVGQFTWVYRLKSGRGGYNGKFN